MVSFVVDKLSFSSSSSLDENVRKFLVRFGLQRSRRGENLMELKNSVWNELCATVGPTTTKMNAHFVPRFFICLQVVNTRNGCLQIPLAGPHACSTSRFPLFGFLIHGYKKNIWRSKRCKVEQHNTNSADKIFCVKEIAAVYIQTFSKLLVFCPSSDNTATDFFVPEL